ncbi:Aminomethyltransferase [Rhodovulum sp. PH10]|uniref:glycine cleavage system aminomethyltransferase GcvT n=1 Tax=Rhodovulum sp. PH10 TaxID=1187851 RepID=UPI00027C1F83|nr:glycine cleavage system aminomethyltransferase GcvT [Rhodovulum sp. PH10]EJW13508.1 Aminomethyltransferase [Rhodovulum sp. PH10]
MTQDGTAGETAGEGTAQTTDAGAKRTPLHALHVRLGARMVPFAGWSMPVQYPQGILAEHRHTRAKAGLFDVSHMGQIALWPRSGGVEEAAKALEALVPADLVGLAAGRQRYGLLTTPAGGILDDLMISNQGDHLYLVVNAACAEADLAHLDTHLAKQCRIEPRPDRALLALQGPEAAAVLGALAPEVAAMRFMDARAVTIAGIPSLVSRSGYTGEDGYEIALPAEAAESFAETLLKNPLVAPVGLGARDSLRLEAGLCLSGTDIGPDTTPVEAGLGWSIQKVRRTGGLRAGGFPGAETIFAQLAEGAPRVRVGLRPEGRAPVRGGAPLFRDETGGAPVGSVTSGGFGPTVEAPVAMGYVTTADAVPGTRLFAEVRGKRLPVAVATLPFVPPRFVRP